MMDNGYFMVKTVVQMKRFLRYFESYYHYSSLKVHLEKCGAFGQVEQNLKTMISRSPVNGLSQTMNVKEF